jgi:4-amino-4-deoxy-L-arabinose transferase-like glycosyltransferase
VVGAALARALLGALVPVLPDEAYYWEWTRRLAAGYFDHPPGIAVLLAGATGLLGHSAAGIRAGPAAAAVVTHVAALVLAWALAGRGAGGAVAARRAAVLVAVLPLAAVGLPLATPDAPLFAATMLVLVAVERALAAPPRSRGALAWWGAAGVALGAALQSKYTAVLIPLGLLAACLAHPMLRRRLREPGPWLASALAAAAFAPVVWWNAQHEWISFRFQLGHGFRGVPRGTPLGRELELLGGQAALASPILFGLLAVAVAAAVRDGWQTRQQDAPTAPAVRRFALGVMAVVPLLFFGVSAWRRSPEANWPAMAYPAALALLAVSPAPWAAGVWWRRGVGVAVGLLVLVMAQAWRPLLPLSPRRDPVARAHGWEALARAVRAAQQDPFLAGGAPPGVAANRYQEAAQLALHLPGQPAVFSLNLRSRRNQYDLWPTASRQVRPGGSLVAVLDATAVGDSLAAEVGAAFAAVRPGPVVALARGARVVTTRRLWLFRERRGPIPAPAPLLRAEGP